jgi:hypothetical protein
MSSTRGYSNKPMSRLQFLMLEAVEQGATLNEAADWALDWAARHPDVPLFEYHTHARWCRMIDSAAQSRGELAPA